MSILAPMKTKPKQRSQAYMTAIEMYHKTARTGVARKVTIEQYSSVQYDIATIEDQTAQYIPEDLVVLSSGWLHQVMPKAMSLVVYELMPNLKKNNALWYYKPLNSYDRAALKQMRDIGILMPTEEPFIHFVNPEFVRKGSRVGVLAMTVRELEGCGRVSVANIRDLRGTKADVNPFHMLGT